MASETIILYPERSYKKFIGSQHITGSFTFDKP